MALSLLQEMRKEDDFRDNIKQALKAHAPDDSERNRIEQVKEQMEQLYFQLYDTVEEGKRHGGNPHQMKGTIVLLPNQIYEFEDTEQKCLEAERDLEWFLEELEGIQEFKPNKERIEFRPDILSRIVEKGIHPDWRIVYELNFGIQLNATGNEKMAWRLRKKGKPRKKKK